MKTVLYANNMTKMGKRLENKIQEELPGIQLDILNSIEFLSQKLCQPLNRISVIVGLISSSNELMSFIALRALLENIRLILVLPDRGEKMTALGIQLNPSFISYADNNLNDIIAVLKKIQKLQLTK